MPESTCLHIQDRESGPIRVVELPWISVRIGRAAYCEVRLSGEDLPDETCRLTRRGRIWSLVPSGNRNSVVLEGRTIKGPCPLPFDVPFQIGCYCLTLRHDVTAEPDWEIYPAPVLFPVASSRPLAPFELSRDAEENRDRPAVVPTPASEPVGGASRPAHDRSRWEARWKAAEAHLKSRATGFRVAGEGHGSASPSPFDVVPSPERPTTPPRPSGTGASTPLIDPKSRSIPTPRVPRIEPGRSAIHPQPPPAVAPMTGHSQHDLDRVVRPLPDSVALRFESNWSGPPEPSSALPEPPSSAWTDWIASEQPTDPVNLGGFAEPVRPDDVAPDTGSPAASSAAAELDTASELAPRERSLFDDPDFELPDFGIETSDSRFPMEEPGEVRTSDTEGIAETGRASTDDGGEVRSTNAEPVDESPPASTIDATEIETAITKESSEIGSENPESGIRNPEPERDVAASIPEQPGEWVKSDPRPGGWSQVEERAAIESPRSLAEPNRSDRDRRAATPAKERFEDPSRPLARDPRNRRADRARTGRGSRAGEVTTHSDSSRSGATAMGDEAVWPSVKDILANHRASPGPKPAVMRRRPGAQPLPTVPREPGEWMLPLWLAWPPLAVSVLLAGLGACGLSWFWAVEASSTAFVTQRLMTSDGSGRHRPLPASIVPPDGRWLTTTAQHLAHWAIYLREAPVDPNGPAPDVSMLLTRALQISPLNPTARLALAQNESPGSHAPASLRTLGLSRDAVSLAWSARRLLGEGKKDAALRLYKQALTVASASGIPRTVTPRFHDDPVGQRYLLPGEDMVRDIVAEMAARNDWTYQEWSKALPQNPTVLLATARLFRETRRDEAEPLLELILEEDVSRSAGGAGDPRALAARAEALAMRSRLKDAEREYRQAIDLVENDLIRRSWWFNLAEIARRLNDESQWQTALRAASAVERSDDISRRVISIQRAADSRAPVSIPSAKAN